jgi:hypothetical protein
MDFFFNGMDVREPSWDTFKYYPSIIAGIAQSVQRLDTGWTTEGSEFEPGRLKISLHDVHTGSGAHAACCPMGTGGSFLW